MIRVKIICRHMYDTFNTVEFYTIEDAKKYVIRKLDTVSRDDIEVERVEEISLEELME